MTLLPTICEVWSQNNLSEAGGREALTKAHNQMIVLTDQMHQNTQTGQMNAQSGESPRIVQRRIVAAGENTTRKQMNKSGL